MKGKASELAGHVLNVNIPSGYQVLRGLKLCRQGTHMSASTLVEVENDDHFVKNRGHKDSSIQLEKASLRCYKFRYWGVETDDGMGSDSQAMHAGWVSVTPLTCFSDVPLTEELGRMRHDRELVQETVELLNAVGNDLKIDVDCKIAE